MADDNLGRTEAAVGWHAVLVIDSHRCGPCEDCPADRTRVCRRLQDARIELVTLGVPHGWH
jgi:hypothetical protein